MPETLYSNATQKVVSIISGGVLLSCTTLHISDNLSQNTLVNTLIRSSRTDMTSDHGFGYGMLNDIEYGDFWFIPSERRVTAEDVWRRFKFMSVGGHPTIWKYTYDGSAFSCYLHCTGSSPAYPVTPRGLRLYVSSLDPRSIKIEKVCMVDNDDVTTFTKDCRNCGLSWQSETEPNSFRFSFSPNRSAAPRFWQIQFYYTQDSSYDEWRKDIGMITGEDYSGKQWPIATLNFLQLPDEPHASDKLDSLANVYEKKIGSID